MSAIFFDLDGTLLHYTTEYSTIVEETITELCGHCDETVVESYNNQFFDNFANCVENPYAKAFEAVDIDGETDNLVSLLKHKELEMCEKPAGIDELLSELGEIHHLGVLTNGVTQWQHEKLRQHSLSQYFDHIIATYEIGAHKPDPDVFAFAQTKVPDEEILMVGDSMEDDIRGAENAGWETLHYEHDGFSSLKDDLTLTR